MPLAHLHCQLCSYYMNNCGLCLLFFLQACGLQNRSLCPNTKPAVESPAAAGPMMDSTWPWVSTMVWSASATRYWWQYSWVQCTHTLIIMMSVIKTLSLVWHKYVWTGEDLFLFLWDLVAQLFQVTSVCTDRRGEVMFCRECHSCDFYMGGQERRSYVFFQR